MENFPKIFTPDYDMSGDLYEINLCRLRKKIYEFVLKGKEKDFFDLEKFKNNRVKDGHEMDRITTTIRRELEELGWKTKVVFGDTALVVYTGEGSPATWGTEF